MIALKIFIGLLCLRILAISASKLSLFFPAIKFDREEKLKISAAVYLHILQNVSLTKINSFVSALTIKSPISISPIIFKKCSYNS